MDDNKLKIAVAMLSVASNGLLVVVKLIVGFAMGSISVISEAIHSGIDIIAALIALIGVRGAGRPADQQHAFGHGKFESLSGLVQAFLISMAAAWIVREAIDKLIHPRTVAELGQGIAVMIVSALVNYIVAQVIFRVANRTDSLALRADAWHCLTDTYTSAGVFAGLGLIWLCEKLFAGSHFGWIDPAVAILVSLLILKAAWDLAVEAMPDLLDMRLPQHQEAVIREVLSTEFPAIRGWHDLRTRRAGSAKFIEFHIKVDRDMTAGDLHDLDHAISGRLEHKLPGAHVMLHSEPCDGDRAHCSEKCRSSCLDRR